MNEERKEFLRSVRDLNTPRPVRQTTIVTLQGGDLAVAELINFMLRGVVEVGELNAIDRLVPLGMVPPYSTLQGVLAMGLRAEKSVFWPGI